MRAELSSPAHLADGGPGCWNKFHGGAMTPSEVKQLSPACQNFRKDYFASIDQAKKNSVQYEKKLIQVLTDAKKPKAPYEAILFATMIHTDKLKAALAKRAAIEKKLNVAFPYAEVAMVRLNESDCGKNPHYLNRTFEEICLGSDTILPVYFGGRSR